MTDEILTQLRAVRAFVTKERKDREGSCATIDAYIAVAIDAEVSLTDAIDGVERLTRNAELTDNLIKASKTQLEAAITERDAAIAERDGLRAMLRDNGPFTDAEIDANLATAIAGVERLTEEREIPRKPNAEMHPSGCWYENCTLPHCDCDKLTASADDLAMRGLSRNATRF
jgi:hypothetical protein